MLDKINCFPTVELEYSTQKVIFTFLKKCINENLQLLIHVFWKI